MKTTIKLPARFDYFVDCMGADLDECIELAQACKNSDIFVASCPYFHTDAEDFYGWVINL